MFSPNSVNTIGLVAVGVLAFMILMCIQGMRAYLRDKREERVYTAGEPERNVKADRMAARAVASATRDAKSRTQTAKPKPVTAAVKVSRPKSAPVPVQTSARARASQKWDPWGNDM